MVWRGYRVVWRGEEWYGGEECVRVEECCGEVRSGMEVRSV